MRDKLGADEPRTYLCASRAIEWCAYQEVKGEAKRYLHGDLV